MTGNIPYIGSKISLITTSDIRYEGILYTLNREESTIAVQNVRSFGTEGRRLPEVPMSNEIYDFIIFRGKDLKDLTVLQGAPEHRQAPGAGGCDAGSGFMDRSGHGNSMYSLAPAHADRQQGSYTSTGMNSFQRPSVGSTAQALVRNNGYLPSSQASVSGGLSSQPLPAVSPSPNPYAVGGVGLAAGSSGSRLADKSGLAPYGGVGGVAAAVHNRQSFPSAEPAAQQDYQAMLGASAAAAAAQVAQQEHSLNVMAARAPGLYEESNASREASDEAKGAAQRGAMGGIPGNKASLDQKDEKARGRGKGGALKKPLFEVLRFHKRAEETIVKVMRTQGSANLGPAELRSMSEINPSVYHFYLDFVNYCCPSHMVQTDEQQWEMLCKALKKHFEKEFGAGQGQKLAQPQRPNNTLGDFITITESKAAKKSNKVPAAPPRVGGGGGRGAGKASGRGDKKDGLGEVDGTGGYDESPAQSSSWACPRCTLRNENLLLECAACGTSKQQAALWAEFPPLG